MSAPQVLQRTFMELPLTNYHLPITIRHGLMASLPVDKSARRIREMFDDISPRYDFLTHLLSLNADVRWRRRAAELCDAPRTALDVCCGTADLALELRRRWGARVVASDFSGRMVRLGDLKARRQSAAL